MGKFEDDLKIAEIGEEKTINFFKSRNVHKIEDVRNDEFWREYDVDFIITENDGNIYKIETKTDTLAHITGNIVYEAISNKYINSKGCFEKTKSDFIFYYLSEIDKMYYINVELLRIHIYNNDYKLINMGDNALGFLVRLSKLIDEGIMKEI